MCIKHPQKSFFHLVFYCDTLTLVAFVCFQGEREKERERERHSFAAGLAVRANNFVRLSHEGPRSRTVGSREEEEVAPPVVCVCGDSLAMT